MNRGESPSIRSWIAIVAFLFGQILSSLYAFISLQLFEVDIRVFNIVHVYFRNELYGHTFHLSLIGSHIDYDIAYLLQASASDLEKFYPNFASVIWAVGCFVSYVIPVLIVGMIVKVYWKNRFKLLAQIKRGFKLAYAPAFFATALLASLLLYFLLCPVSSQSVEFQITLARIFLVTTACFLGISVWLERIRILEAIKSFLFYPALPYSLAITRILFFSYLIFLYLIVFRVGHGSNIGLLDKVGLPGIEWLVSVIPINQNIYSAMCYLGAFSSLMVVLGYKSRLFLFLNSIIIFYVVATPNFFGKLWHEQIVIWISWIIGASPCADILSIDSMTNEKTRSSDEVGYNFHLKIIWLHFGLIYFFAGFYKLWLSGFDWALSDSLISLVQIEWFENYDVPSSLRMDKLPTLLKACGLLTILFEMFYIIFLFYKRTRWVSIVGGLVMHNLIGMVMYISFFTLLQVFYFVYVPWNWILIKFGVVANTEDESLKSPNLTSFSVVIPILILAMNIIYGMFRIDSYPFSVYPVYCDILSPTVKYFDYRFLDSKAKDLDFRQEGEKANFRWEDYSRQEYELIRMHQSTGELDTAGVRTMWKRWQIGVPSLSEIDSLDVYVVERPLDPEKADVRLSDEYLMTISQ